MKAFLVVVPTPCPALPLISSKHKRLSPEPFPGFHVQSARTVAPDGRLMW
jgi:hypothetical protein